MSKKTRPGPGVPIYRMLGNCVAPYFIRPHSILYGMDGTVWVWHEAQAWIENPPPDATVEIRRKAKDRWFVTIPDDVSINAGDPEASWVPVEIYEETRVRLNEQPFTAVVEGMQGMGTAFADLGEAFTGASRAIASGSRTMATMGGKKGRKMVMVPVVDKTDGEIKILSMSEEKAKKLKYLAGHSIAEIVMDELPNGTISFDEDGNQTFKSMGDEIQEILDEDDGTPTLNVMDILANKFEPNPKR